MQRLDLCGGWEFYLQNAPEKRVPVRLPHDFSIGSPRTPGSPMGSEGGWFQGGVGVYERLLTLSPPPAHAVLVFEGCMGETQVWLNGELLAEHSYGYTEFHADLSGRLTGADRLRVVVDNTLLPAARWYTGSGLYRPVWLAVGGEVCIPLWSARVSTPEIMLNGVPSGTGGSVPCQRGPRKSGPGAARAAGGEGADQPTRAARAVAEVSFAARNSGAEAICPLSVELLDPDGVPAARLAWRQPLPRGATHITRRLVLDAPALWSPESPALYTARITAGEDRETVRFGVRQVTVSPEEGLRLNGRPIKLRGGCIHHDNGPLGACAYPRAERRRAAKLKAAGFNALRSAHDPPSTALLDACDRLGLLVLDEAFDGWRQGKTVGDIHRVFDVCWRQELAAMILRDRNHPSVILYSTGNEVAERCTPEGAALSRALADEARRLDPTRPVCCGVNGTFVEGGKYQGLLSNLLNGEGAALKDAPAEVRELLQKAGEAPQDWGALTEAFIAPLDLAGYNYLDFRYAPDRARFPRRVICGTESFPKLMDTVWRRTMESPNVIGDFTWAAWDYLGESGIGRAGYGEELTMFAPWPYHLATCGDFDICGRPRPQSWMRRALWGAGQRPGLWVLPPDRQAKPETVTAWGWPDLEESWTFPGREGHPVRVEIYTNAEEVELWLNAEKLARGPVSGCRAAFVLNYRPGVLRAVGLRGGRPAEEALLETAGAPAALCLSAEEPALFVGGDIVYLWAEVRDAAGRIVPWAGPEIRCEIAAGGASGPGEEDTEGPRIIACGSGDPRAAHSYAGNVCRGWRGRALFILRSGKTPGRLTLRASAAGLAPGVCTVEAVPQDRADILL